MVLNDLADSFCHSQKNAGLIGVGEKVGSSDEVKVERSEDVAQAVCRHCLQTFGGRNAQNWNFLHNSLPDFWPVCFTVGAKRHLGANPLSSSVASPLVTCEWTTKIFGHSVDLLSFWSPVTISWNNSVTKWPWFCKSSHCVFMLRGLAYELYEDNLLLLSSTTSYQKPYLRFS